MNWNLLLLSINLFRCSHNLSLRLSNAGIKWIGSNSVISLLWKSSNVPIQTSDKLLRPASVSVSHFVASMGDNRGVDTSRIFDWVRSSSNGLVMISHSDATTAILSRLKRHSCFTTTVQGVFEGSLSKDEVSLKINNKFSEGIKQIVITERSESVSHGYLSHVIIKLEGLVPIISQDELLNGLESLGMPCVKSGPSYLLALTGIDYQSTPSLDDSENGEFQILMENIKSNHNVTITQSDIDKSWKIEAQTPSKFYKYMKRESLFASRHHKLNHSSFTDLSLVNFLDIKIKYRISSLMPRISSEIIVKTALKYLEILIQKYSNQKINSGNNYRRIRIMDLGCSSGALILPVVAKLCEMIRETCKSYDDNLLDQHIKCGERTGSHTMNGWHIEAVGVDIDNESLLLALENVKLNCDKFMTDIVTCSHSDGDYNSETVITEPLKDLSESSPKSMTQSTLNFHFVCEDFSRVHRFAVIPLGIPDPSKIWDPNVRLGFDVIFSNPPYLGAAAISGRVTPEGPRCLVGGPTGTEAYQTILGAVRAGDARGPLLRPGGVLILQLPGKHDKMVGHLQKIARSEGFEVLEVLKDNRGITRCMVASLP